MSSEIIPTEVDEFFVETKDSIKERLQSLATSASNLEVTNEGHFKAMTSLYSESKDWEKRIEFMRKEANAPDQDRINARNDKAKEVLIPLKQIQTIAKQKCERYQLILEEKKREEEKKMQEAVELLGLEETPVVTPVDKSIRGDGALMFTRTVRKFRTVDLSKVPLKYLQVNEELVKQDIRLGVAQISGIEIYETQETTLRSR